MTSGTGPANRLAGETSPYLLQHAHNPVDWYPWGPEALERARREDRPIFLSIGYSACHWCHVMERESFEDDEVAKLLAERFVSIKVDREERPDLDDVYMTAVQAMTGQGGWPLTVFLTPDLHPFYGGTYFPPDDRWGRPGFRTVLTRVHEIFSKQRGRVDTQSRELTDLVRRHVEVPPAASGGKADEEALFPALDRKLRGFDPLHGGFGSAPKFPPSFGLEALTRGLYRRWDPRWVEALTLTLDGMASGGMYDQLGGGFARYSTDERWLVPHFEKMLYDNALLVPVYLEADRLLDRPDYRRVVTETLTWLEREMTDPQGGFWSSQDADSEGVEGKFFVWTPEEVRAVLGADDAGLVEAAYGVSERGNWHEMPGKTVLHRAAGIDALASARGVPAAGIQERLDGCRARLFEARRRRVPPGTDTKVLTAWNGLMIRALAMAGSCLEDPRWLDLARRAAGFCLETMRGERGLLRTWRAGKAHLNGYQEDYAYLIDALLALFEATSEARWLAEASVLADAMIDRFLDREQGGFFFTSHDHESLIVRTKNPMDNATPSGNSSGARALWKLGHFRDEARYREVAAGVVAAFAGSMRRLPEGFMNMVVAADSMVRPPVEVVVVGAAGDPRTRELAGAARRDVHPDVRVLVHDPASSDAAEREALVPWCRDKRPPAGAGGVAVWVCAAGTCRRPVETVDELRRELGDALPSGCLRPPRG